MDEEQIEKIFKQLESQIEKTVNDADPFRVASYGQMERVQSAKQQVLNKQKQRLAARLGPDHSRVKTIESRISLRKQVLRGVQIERKRSETLQPEIDPKDWILHGYVYDEKAEPQSGVHVMLADKSGKLIKQLGRASSDRRGYFRLIAEDIAKLLTVIAASGEIRKKIIFYAQALDDKGVVLHRGGQALQPGPGQTDYLEIVIGKDADVIRRRPIRPVNPIRPVKPARPVARKRSVEPKRSVDAKRSVKPKAVKRKPLKRQ
jgi:hypothetical protein